MSFDALIDNLGPRLAQAAQAVLADADKLNVNDPGQMVQYQAKISLWTRISDLQSALVKMISDLSTKMISRFA